VKLPLETELVPSSIDGFVPRSDLRLTRFFAIGRDRDAVRKVAEHGRCGFEPKLVPGGHAHVLIGA